jgi:hypothetical protein
MALNNSVTIDYSSTVDVKKTVAMNQYNPGIWVNLNDVNKKLHSKLYKQTIQNTKSMCIHKFTPMQFDDQYRQHWLVIN